MSREQRPIVFRVHALNRLRQRGISREQVERTLEEPDREGKGNRPKVKIFEKRFPKKRRLRVYAEDQGRVLKVLSVYWM